MSDVLRSLADTALLTAIALAVSCVVGWLLAYPMRSTIAPVRVVVWIVCVAVRAIPFFCIALYGVWPALFLTRYDIRNPHTAFAIATLCLACLATPRLAEKLARRPASADVRETCAIALAWIARSLPFVVAAALIAQSFLALPGQGRAWHYGGRSGAITIIVVDAIVFLVLRAIVRKWLPVRTHERARPRFRKYAIVLSCIAAAVLLAAIIACIPLHDAMLRIDPRWTGMAMPPCFLNAAACAGHLLGTDEVGRDLLARLTVGLRDSLLLSLWAIVLEAALVAFVVGAVRGNDALRCATLRLANVVASLLPWPTIAIVAFLSPLALFGAPLLVPVVTAVILCSWSLPAILSANASSAHFANVALRDYRRAILILATIDFFGYGLQPPHPSLGNLFFNAQALYVDGPWVIFFTTALLVAVSLAIDLWRRAAIATDVPGTPSPARQNEAR